MSTRAERRRQARRLAAPPPKFPPPRGDLTVADLQALPRDQWKPGDPMIASAPGATDGTPESLADVRRLTHDDLIRDVDASGAVRLGPVSWSDWGPEQVPEVLAALIDQDPKYADLAPWFVEHPTGHLVLAMVVAQPAEGDTPETPIEDQADPPGSPCPDCGGSGIYTQNHGPGLDEHLGCDGCLGIGRVPRVDAKGYPTPGHLDGCDQDPAHYGPCLVPGRNVP